MPPLAVEVTRGGAPCDVVFVFPQIVVHCGTRVVLLSLVKEREDACRAFGGATTSFWTLTNKK